VVVESPDASPLAIDVLGGKPDKVLTSKQNSRTTVRYVWEKPPTHLDEPFAPAATEIFPTVVGSTFATWGDFRSWYQAATRGFNDPDAEIRELAAKLTKDKKTRDDKLKALFEFVADDIRYVNYTSAEAWLPNRPHQLLARRQGDCDDKATLLVTLLKAVGID